MPNRFQTVLSVALTLFGLSSVASHVLAAPDDTAKKAELKPDVAALLKQSTEAYQKMKTYQHTAAVKLEISAQGEKHDETKKYTLALERPNKFCYKLNEGAASGAAVSDGKTSFIYKNDQK